MAGYKQKAGRYYNLSAISFTKPKTPLHIMAMFAFVLLGGR